MSYLFSLEKNKVSIKEKVFFLFLCFFVSTQSADAARVKQSREDFLRKMFKSISMSGRQAACLPFSMPALVSARRDVIQAVKSLVDEFYLSLRNGRDRDFFDSNKMQRQLVMYCFISNSFSFLDAENDFRYEHYMSALSSLKAYWHSESFELAQVDIELLRGLQFFFAEKVAAVVKEKYIIKVANRVSDEPAYLLERNKKSLKEKREQLKEVKIRKTLLETVGRERISPDNMNNPDTKNHLVLSSFLKKSYNDLSLKAQELESDIERLGESQTTLPLQGKGALFSGCCSVNAATDRKKGVPEINIYGDDGKLIQPVTSSGWGALCAFLKQDVFDIPYDSFDSAAKRFEFAVWLISLSTDTLLKYARFPQKQLVKKYISSHANNFAVYVSSIHFQTELKLPARFDLLTYLWLNTMPQREGEI